MMLILLCPFWIFDISGCQIAATMSYNISLYHIKEWQMVTHRAIKHQTLHQRTMAIQYDKHFESSYTSACYRNLLWSTLDNKLFSMLIIILFLVQVANAVFDGIPLRPAKSKLSNSGGYDIPSTLPGLLYSKRDLFNLGMRQETTCPPGYRTWLPLYDISVNTKLTLHKLFRVLIYTAAPRNTVNV